MWQQRQALQPQPQDRQVLRLLLLSLPVAAAVRSSDTGSNSSSGSRGRRTRTPRMAMGAFLKNVLLKTVPHQLVPATSTTVRTSMTSPHPFSQPLSH